MGNKKPEHIKRTLAKLMDHYRIKLNDDQQFMKLLEELGVDPSKCEPEELVSKLTEHMKMTIKTVKDRGGGLNGKNEEK